MPQAAPPITRPPAEVVRLTPVSQAPNGICYAASGEITVPEADLQRMVSAVPDAAAAALNRIRAALRAAEKTERTIEMNFRLPDRWGRRLFLALCRR